MEKLLQVGVISSTHGVRGEVKVFPTTDDVKRFKKLKKVILDTGREHLPLEVESVKFFKQFAILKFKGIDNINDIEKYKGKSLLVDREHAVKLRKDEYFIADMIGLTVFTDDGEEFGKLRDVLETGANDVYIIDSLKHGEVLVPAIKQCILDVDIENGKMVIHLMEGLVQSMNFHILTLFPEMVMDGLSASIIGRAQNKGLLSVEAINIRDFAENKHNRVDDYTYGGGAGMLMQAGPVYGAYQSVVEKAQSKPRVIYLSPQGQTFSQTMAEEFAKEEELIFLCGHYEGIDERVLEEIVTDYVSIGDYVLTGGELPAMVMIDAISRLIPGVLHNDVSAEFESFQDNLLEYPQYTRPEEWHGKKVPEILLSGHHANVEKWRREQSIIRTAQRRPDLLEKAELTEKEKAWLEKQGLSSNAFDDQPKLFYNIFNKGAVSQMQADRRQIIAIRKQCLVYQTGALFFVADNHKNKGNNSLGQYIIVK